MSCPLVLGCLGCSAVRRPEAVYACFTFSHWLVYANSAANPIIYNFSVVSGLETQSNRGWQQSPGQQSLHLQSRLNKACSLLETVTLLWAPPCRGWAMRSGRQATLPAAAEEGVQHLGPVLQMKMQTSGWAGALGVGQLPPPLPDTCRAARISQSG